MRIAKFILLLIGILELVLAVGFFFQQTWATALWHVPDTRLSYAFIAAILGGGGAPLIWIGLSDLRMEQPALAVFTFVMGILAAICSFLFFRAPRALEDNQPTPRIVRLTFYR